MAVEIRLENGKLLMEPQGQRALELHPYAPNGFFLKEVDGITVVFPGVGPGKATEITITQGAEQKGKRIE